MHAKCFGAGATGFTAGMKPETQAEANKQPASSLSKFIPLKRFMRRSVILRMGQGSDKGTCCCSTPTL